MTTDAFEQRPWTTVQEMVNAYRITGAVRAMVVLKIADHLGTGPLPVDDLAAATETHAPSLTRLLRTLASLELCEITENGMVQLTPSGHRLRSDASGSLKHFVLALSAPYVQHAWEELPHAVRTGQPAFQTVHGTNFWEYLASHPADGANFDGAMTQVAAGQADALRASCDLSGVSMVVDVGGGQGRLLAELLTVIPTLRATLFDRPEVSSSAGEVLKAAGVADRCEIVGGSFFASIPPGGDAYVLAQILHDWQDQEALTILQACREAMAPNGRIWIIERLVDPDREFDRDRERYFNLLDLHMLVLFGAQERTADEYRRLLEDAGFGSIRVLATDTEWSVIEGIAA